MGHDAGRLQGADLAGGEQASRARHREARHVDGERPDQLQGAADHAPVPGDRRGTGHPDLLGRDSGTESPRYPDAVSVLTGRDVGEDGAGVVVVLGGGVGRVARAGVTGPHCEMPHSHGGAFGRAQHAGAEVGVVGRGGGRLDALADLADVAGAPDGDMAVDAPIVLDHEGGRASQLRVLEPRLRRGGRNSCGGQSVAAQRVGIF